MNQRIFAVAGFAIIAALLPACSGAGPDGSQATGASPGAGGAPAASGTTPAVASRTARRLKIGQSSPIVVQTLPGASCTMHPESGKNEKTGDENRGSMKLDADDDGVVAFYLRPNNPAPLATFLIDCVTPEGATGTYALDISSDTEGDGITPTVAPPSTSRTRPPLQGDLDAPSQGDLVSRGYPLRPDANKEPQAYAQWRAEVTRPYTIVSPRLVAHPERAHVQSLAAQPVAHAGEQHAASKGPGFGEVTGTAGTWSGAVMTNPPIRYWIVNANWNIPNLDTPPSAYPIDVPADAAEWVGLDGWNGGSLEQSGSDSNTETFYFWFSGTFTSTQYGLWIQNPPTSPWFIPNMKAAPGDHVTINVFLADQYGSTWYTNGDLDSRDNSVWFMVDDSTQNTSYWGTYSRPSSFQGISAEFIIERGQPYNNATPVLADFGFQGMFNCEFGDTWAGSMWLYDGGPPFYGTLNQISMVNGSDQEDAAYVWGSVANGNPGSIFWVWENQ